MAFREFIGRHRIVSTVAAPAALGVAAIVAATWALTSTPGPQTADTQLKASVTECHDMVTISVAGRNDTPVAGTTKMLVDANGNELPAALSGDYSSHWVDPVVNAPGNAVGPNSYAAVYIAYPANMSSYEDAVNTGVGNTEKVMHDIAQACPNTKFSIVGYSEGADVVRRVARTIGHQQPNQDGVVDPNHVLGVVILADAGRTAGQGPFPGAKDPFGNPDGFDQKYQNGTQPISGQGALPDTGGDFGSLNGKIASFCSEGDLTCAAPQNISLLQLAANVGRQLDVDSLQRDGLTPATGQDVAVVLGRVAMSAFADIASQPNWMQSNETFLQVLLRVSDPEYKPGQAPKPPVQATAISQTQLSPLAYLPQKVFNEIVGLIVTNQNTIPVIMSDPYQLTLGPNGTGHHFDYWRDNDPNNGKPLTSAEYAAAWLTALAKQAQAGKQVDPATKPQQADLVAAYKAADDVKAQRAAALSATPTTTGAAPTTTSASPTTGATPTTTASGTPTTVAPTTSASAIPAPTTTVSPSQTPAPTTTVAPTTSPAATTTTTAAPTTTTTVPAPPTTTGAAVRVAN
ncbi:cutinase family protein [Nocardia terpenica]|uniref:Cutinase family protein n=1 Tax=Nocardia terpenica TaxID=455432 RepID=A0A6G9ZCW1_9NOCA|nr:cutinase family protein [Nocardia terpenica]QIS23270.1 cutinase family protein [Nocardia terpenica]